MVDAVGHRPHGFLEVGLRGRIEQDRSCPWPAGSRPSLRKGLPPSPSPASGSAKAKKRVHASGGGLAGHQRRRLHGAAKRNCWTTSPNGVLACLSALPMAGTPGHGLRPTNCAAPCNHRDQPAGGLPDPDGYPCGRKRIAYPPFLSLSSRPWQFGGADSRRLGKRQMRACKYRQAQHAAGKQQAGRRTCAWPRRLPQLPVDDFRFIGLASLSKRRHQNPLIEHVTGLPHRPDHPKKASDPRSHGDDGS